MIAWKHLRNSPVFSKIQNEWSALLDDKTRKEQDYQLFLREHAGFFFPRKSDISGDQLVLEKISLGSDYITDFVNINGNRSYGFEYTFIEIESPHDEIYTGSGKQTSDLSGALEQVRDWKRWIAANTDTAKRLFPSKRFLTTGVPSIRYMVVIGRRNSSQDEIEKRNQIFRDEGIEVRSFDYLTDILLTRAFHSHIWISNDFSFISEADNNEFANPFYTAISDATWRAMLKKFLQNYSHMVGQNMAAIIESRKYNKQRENEFLEWVAMDGDRNSIDAWEKELLTYT